MGTCSTIEKPISTFNVAGGKSRFGIHSIGISMVGVACLLIHLQIWPLNFLWVQAVGIFVAIVPLTLYDWFRTHPDGSMHWVRRTALRIKPRPIEQNTRTSSLDYVLGLSIVWILHHTTGQVSMLHVAVACFITAWSDPIARIVGQSLGKTKWPGMKKTLLGSFACWATAVTVCILFTILYSTPDLNTAVRCQMVGLVTMLFELVPQTTWKVDRPLMRGEIISPADNFCIMVSTTLALGWLL